MFFKLFISNFSLLIQKVQNYSYQAVSDTVAITAGSLNSKLFH